MIVSRACLVRAGVDGRGATVWRLPLTRCVLEAEEALATTALTGKHGRHVAIAVGMGSGQLGVACEFRLAEEVVMDVGE